MSGCFHIPPFVEDVSWRVEEECRSYNSYVHFPIVLFLSYDTKLIMELSRRVWYELDAETTWSRELLVREFAILRYADDLYTELREFTLKSREVLCFECTSRSIILWVEVEESARGFWEERRERVWHCMNNRIVIGWSLGTCVRFVEKLRFFVLIRYYYLSRTLKISKLLEDDYRYIFLLMILILLFLRS